MKLGKKKAGEYVIPRFGAWFYDKGEVGLGLSIERVKFVNLVKMWRVKANLIKIVMYFYI